MECYKSFSECKNLPYYNQSAGVDFYKIFLLVILSTYSTPIDCLETRFHFELDCIGAPTAFFGIHEAQSWRALHMQ